MKQRSGCRVTSTVAMHLFSIAIAVDGGEGSDVQLQRLRWRHPAFDSCEIISEHETVAEAFNALKQEAKEK